MKIEKINLKSRSTGFSLVELLVVITIIAILSVVAYTALGGQTEKARNARRQSDLSTIQSALEIYFIEHNNKYPEFLDDNKATSVDKDLVPKYMPKMAKDPSNDNPYGYAVIGSNKKYQLAATLEDEDALQGVRSYVVGNSITGNLIGGVLASDGVSDCSPPEVPDDSEVCIPYAL